MLQKKDSQKNEIHLREYSQVILRRKWIIAATFIIFVTFVTFQSFKATHIYQATTQVKIDRETPNVLSFEEVAAIDKQDLIFYQTQYKIMSSRSLALRVINALNLQDNPEFKSDNKSKSFSIRRLLRSLVKRESKVYDKTEHKSEDIEKSELIDRYIQRLKIAPIKWSSLVYISFSGVNPKEIKNIINRHAREYIDSNLEVRYSASNDAVKWLQKQILIKKELVEKAENSLQLYREKKNIVSLEGRHNIIVQKLEDLNRKLTNFRTERMKLETLYNLTKKYAGKQEMLETIPEIMKNSLIVRLKNQHVSLLTEIKKLSKKYGKNHPSMIIDVTKAEELKAKIDEEITTIVKSIATKYKVTLSQEKGLSGALEEQKVIALQLNRDAIAYGTLKRDSEGEKAMYEILVKRLKETNMTSELRTSNISIVDPAETPRAPIKPRKMKNVLLGALLGLFIGIGLAFFIEYLDDTIKKPEDVEQFLSIPLLGVIEKIRAKTCSPDLIAYELPKSITAEAVRSVRTNIMTSMIDKRKKLVMVTSAVQGEGKTFMASNLAYTIAQTGKKTLLIDTDLRKPRLNDVFNVAMKPGLADYHNGECNLESIVKNTSVPNLSIITCGTIPPNPSEILESTIMEKFCKEIKYMFDIVIFDTSPSLAITDAVALSRKMDGVIITIKSGSTLQNAAKRCILKFQKSKCEMFGAIINYAYTTEGNYYYNYTHNDKYRYSSEKELQES
ncbi:MAG: polysaccharide biosynthesis tyrosine autokinase [Candidatus Brocadiaceae bacterium]|nr:polysaccharide biosynthesis tyrosine autokinase [Candidatus Brocadiaceae bacterium]